MTRPRSDLDLAATELRGLIAARGSRTDGEHLTVLLDRLEALEAERDELRAWLDEAETASGSLEIARRDERDRADRAEAALARVTSEAEIAERRAEHAYKILDRVTDDSMAEKIAQAIHDGPEAQKQYADAGIAPHEWSSCVWKAQYRADAAHTLAVIRAVAADEQEVCAMLHPITRLRCSLPRGHEPGHICDTPPAAADEQEAP